MASRDERSQVVDYRFVFGDAHARRAAMSMSQRVLSLRIQGFNVEMNEYSPCVNNLLWLSERLGGLDGIQVRTGRNRDG